MEQLSFNLPNYSLDVLNLLPHDVRFITYRSVIYIHATDLLIALNITPMYLRIYVNTVATDVLMAGHIVRGVARDMYVPLPSACKFCMETLIRYNPDQMIQSRDGIIRAYKISSVLYPNVISEDIVDYFNLKETSINV